ncbi:MAG TPA: hypothetical protein VIM58_02815, partial [Candidatus Methylacidiphilales bacterium]
MLLTTIVVGLLFLVGNDRRAGAGYSEKIRAQEVAMAGIETAIGDLRREMRSGSTILASKGIETWLPLTPVSMRIAPIGRAPGAANHLRSSTSFSPTTVFPAPDYNPSLLPPNRVGTLCSTNYSRNGIRIPLALWDKVALAPAGALASTPPYWIYLQRAGVSSRPLSWGSDLTNAAPSNTSYVLGRYAYQLYDVGGLLDLNAAGAPSGLSAADRRALEGTLAGIDLTLLGNGIGASVVSDLLQFRNPATSAHYVDAFTNLPTCTNGFMSTAVGDNRFLSRSDLIRFAQKEGITNALPLLTHFSRDLNAPSWQPAYDATQMGGSGYAYRTASTNNGAVNPFVPAVLGAGGQETFYDLQGRLFSTNLPSGTPRAWKRFPLARIAWLPQVASGTTSLQPAVLAHFGLNWDAARKRWVYNPNGGTTASSSILTLDAVPAGRQPNFFELLKAGILSGSLGLTRGQAANNLLLTRVYNVSLGTAGIALQDPNADYHVMKIGAAIIDQYTPGSEPTAIDFDYAPTLSSANPVWAQTFRAPATGVKNLPYLYT